MRATLLLLIVLAASLTLLACSERSEVAATPPAATATVAPAATTPSDEPPTPPIHENFEGEPQLSLFPRVGAARPDADDAQAEGVWVAYIDHLLRLSGVRSGAGRNGSRGWVVGSLRAVDSLAFFAPLAVRPGASYRVAFDFAGDLPKGGRAGVGVLEFDQFFWIGEQFPQAFLQAHQTAVYPGLSLTGQQAWAQHSFTFTVSPRAGMIHLLLFREGAMEREHPVRFDNLVIEELLPLQGDN